MSTIYQEKAELFTEAAKRRKGKQDTDEIINYIVPQNEESKSSDTKKPLIEQKQEQVRKLLREYISGCGRFSLQGFHGFIAKKHETDTQTLKTNPTQDLEDEVELEGQILAKLDSDCKHFRFTAMEVYLKTILEILQNDEPDPHEFSWARSQFSEITCTTENGHLVIRGRVHDSAHVFTIKSFDITEHLQAMEAEKLREQRQDGTIAYADGIIGVAQKVGDAASNLDPRRSPTKCMKALRNSLGCPDSVDNINVSVLNNAELLHQLLYSLQSTFGIRAREDLDVISRKSGVEFAM